MLHGKSKYIYNDIVQAEILVSSEMRVVQQPIQLPIDNLDLLTPEDVNAHPLRHGALLPSSLRMIICGPSSAGKTNVMLSLIFDPNGLKFENIYVYSKSLYQPKYKMLEKVLKTVKGIGYYPYTDNDDIIDPADAKENSVFIFDDVACDKQDKIRAYFSMGRHCRVESFYLCQSYTRIPKHLVRDNANVLVLFKQDDLNLKHVFDDHVTTDMTFTQFKDLCSLCWKNKYDVLVIVKENDMNNGRYRRGFDHFISM